MINASTKLCQTSNVPHHRILLSVLASLFCCTITLGEEILQTNSDNQSHSDDAAFFENKIRPLLVDKCYECHAGDEAEAGLSLDSQQGWQTGGDSGAAIMVGDPDKSLIMDAVRYTEERVMGMPPDSRLSDDEIKDLQRWIAGGAYDPRQSTQTTSRRPKFDLQERVDQHWSWQPIESPTPPAIENDDWSRDDIDRFVLAKLRAANIHPAKDADPLTWLRRVSFDLTGLPPSLEMIRRIQQDASWETKEQIVDQLLDSPRFGEKWARHWLDLVRYADTYGHEFDYPIENAHRYRDYVIRAFNSDVPYDRFIKEHLAGDLLQSPRLHPEKKYDESIVGTGFWYLHEATHAPTDVLQNEADVVSNQIDVFGKTFLGLTIACARCHDHKFDAISTADYYAFQALLESSCRQEVPLDSYGSRSDLANQIDDVREEFANHVRDSAVKFDDDEGLRAAFAKLSEAKQAFSQNQWDAYSARAKQLADFDTDRIPEGWSTTGRAFQPVTKSPKYLISAVPEGHRSGTVDSGVYGSSAAGTLRSPTFEITSPRIDIWMRCDRNMTVRIVIDHYEMAKFQSLLFGGTIRDKQQTDTSGEYKWISLDGDLKKYIGHQAYLEFEDTGEGSMAIDQIWMSETWPETSPPDGIISMDFDTAKQSLQNQFTDGKTTKLLQRWATTETVNDTPKEILAIDYYSKRLADLSKSWKKAPMAIAMAAGTRQSAPIYIRGGHSNHGELVEPRNLTALGGNPGSRLDLANEIASLQNPLTARVRVNRVWHHLFGTGIVASVDDFGPQGIMPTHPQLLDHLATTFAEDGWSIKRLIRRIVLSRTYGQSSNAHPANDPQYIGEADPTNSLLHRMNIRRLGAEMIRDGILHSAGTLSDQMYGQPIPTHRTAFMTGRGARGSGPLDGEGRRTIYQAVYRNFLNPFLLTFDMPNPFGPKGRRSQSNVPAQSLAMMNDPFVIDQATRWAKQVSGDQRPIEECIHEMALRAHGQPLPDEAIETLVSFVETQTKARQGNQVAALADLAQSLWAMKRYLYLR
ncbi:PSD1 and planctomycete cytochrome C domain-containing protein [Stieleria sp. JC731]|uniref:PSD1 and planctomycete cytochrome C domain-containing protein n=1 Tax=Pirellulaceae TaxID=2691357 RepID=UPI001E38B822|nr:PSD1 and planctomycete cytochrome C domain-containing protein [Stieleria sp. JC731]MCC9602911.1 PSD1 and planctomycete cytochrome C domain-containing protein [Stieleria sp. JC731]